MHQSFLIKSRFHPAYSVYGRWIRHRAGDRLLAESRYVVRAAVLALVLVVVLILAWGFGFAAGEPLDYLGVQAALLFCYVALVLGGFQPAIRIDATDGDLRLQQGPSILRLSADEVLAVKEIDAQLFHRHYRRYAATHVFVNRVEDRLLLIESARGPIVLGLNGTDRQRLAALFDSTPVHAYSSSSVDAA